MERATRPLLLQGVAEKVLLPQGLRRRWMQEKAAGVVAGEGVTACLIRRRAKEGRPGEARVVRQGKEGMGSGVAEEKGRTGFLVLPRQQ